MARRRSHDRRDASLTRALSTHAARAYGPSATGGDLRRFAELTMTLARTEFKLRYFGSALGYLWSLMRPLLFFGVLYVFFTQILNLGKGVPHYGVYLLTGIVLWTYFAEATGGCVACLVARESLLRKVRFPRMVIPLAVSLTSLFNLGMNFIAVIVFALVNGVAPRLSWLELIPIAFGFILLTTGTGMLLAALYVRYRDVQPIWDVVSQILFYASPIMYIASNYKGLEHLAMNNPFAVLLTQMGRSFIHPPPILTAVPGKGLVLEQRMRSAAAAAGGPAHLIIPIALIFGVFALGWWVFTREAPRVAENL
jgi:ABC-2 type transport system permease protein